jgi:hypothetical protein
MMSNLTGNDAMFTGDDASLTSDDVRRERRQ